jgi:hypothetical protein
MIHLSRILKAEDWLLLRRSPPIFVGDSDAPRQIEELVVSQLARVPRLHAEAPGLVSA